MNQQFGSFNLGGSGQFAPMGGGMAPPPIHMWSPVNPQEQQYFDMLFTMADEEKRNAIGGRIAVAFFSRSNIDKTVLREVWNIADSRQRSELSRNEFYVAMRLISMAQRGEQVSVQRFFELATAPFPLPALEGVPPPSQMQMAPQGSPTRSMSAGRGPYAVTDEEKLKYDGTFQQYDTDNDGFLQGSEAVGLFQMSGLDRNVLREVWSLADQGQDSRLDKKEFYIAMHLIVCISKRGLPLPSQLPPELAESAFRVGPDMGGGVPTRSGSMQSANGIGSQPQPEKTSADPMGAFDGLAPSLDAGKPVEAPGGMGSFSAPGGSQFQPPSVVTAGLDMRGSFHGTPSPSPMAGGMAPMDRDRTGSNASMNSMSSFGGGSMRAMTPQASMGTPRGATSSFHAAQPPTPVAAAPTRPFMSDEEETKLVKHLDQQNEELSSSLSTLERKQTAIETVSEKLRELDQLRHEMVTLTMKRDNERAVAAAKTPAPANPAEAQSKRMLEKMLQDLIENEKRLIQKTMMDIGECEREMQELMSMAVERNVTLQDNAQVSAPQPSLGAHGDMGFGGGMTKQPSGFDSFGANPAQSSGPLESPVKRVSASSGFDSFGAFDAPSPAAAPLAPAVGAPPAPASTSSSGGNFDAFAGFGFN